MSKRSAQLNRSSSLKVIIGLVIIFLLSVGASSLAQQTSDRNNDMLVYIMDPQSQTLRFYWKNENNEILQNFSRLTTYVESKNETLLFAMNGGMYTTDYSPLGLFINHGKTVTKLNSAKGKGNFYLAPNGVFFISKKKVANICKSVDFKHQKNVDFATQSGPLLLWDGNIHPAFVKGSTNLNIRNGVGILPNNKVVFVMSKHEVNFYDFASFFKSMGCSSALYLDGFVSRTYLPEKNWIQTDGNFGVMIGVSKPKKQ